LGDSTKSAEGILILDDSFTFSYDPKIDSGTLINFADSSSILSMNNATLHATGTGMSLKSGKLIIEGSCKLSSDDSIITVTTDTTVSDTIFVTATFNRGISIGGEDVSKDCVVEIRPAGKLTLSKGALNYKNLNSSSIRMLSSDSAMRIASSTSLRLYEDLPMTGILSFAHNSKLERVDGKRIIGPIRTEGRLKRKRIFI